MYLLYLDESGTPDGWRSQDQKHFAIGGVAVHEGQVYGLTKQLDEIQERYFPGLRVSIVFHAADIRNGKDKFRTLSPTRRQELLNDLYQCILTTRFPNLIAFATVMHESAAGSPDETLHDTFQDVCQRFNTFLVRQYNFGYKDKGVLVIDRAHEDRYRQLIADFRRHGTDHGYLGNVVDIPFFARSRDTRMIQFADLCAYAVFRYYESSDDTYFKNVLPHFDRRAPQHPPDGLKHITREQCDCIACGWRRERREF